MMPRAQFGNDRAGGKRRTDNIQKFARLPVRCRPIHQSQGITPFTAQEDVLRDSQLGNMGNSLVGDANAGRHGVRSAGESPPSSRKDYLALVWRVESRNNL